MKRNNELHDCFYTRSKQRFNRYLGWYSTESSPETKKRYISDMSKTLKMLEKSPKSYSIRLKNVRCAILKRFPYNIYYWVDDFDSTVNVFAILHQKRSPSIWKDRV